MYHAACVYVTRNGRKRGLTPLSVASPFSLLKRRFSVRWIAHDEYAQCIEARTYVGRLCTGTTRRGYGKWWPVVEKGDSTNEEQKRNETVGSKRERERERELQTREKEGEREK